MCYVHSICSSQLIRMDKTGKRFSQAKQYITQLYNCIIYCFAWLNLSPVLFTCVQRDETSKSENDKVGFRRETFRNIRNNWITTNCRMKRQTFRSYSQLPSCCTASLNAVSNEREGGLQAPYSNSLDNQIINGPYESVRMTTKAPWWWHSPV
jgi:hypothetical protein